LREKLFRYLMNEMMPAERSQIEKLLEENEEARNYLLHIETLWRESAEEKHVWDIDEAWERISHEAGIHKHLPTHEKSSSRLNRYEDWKERRYYRTSFAGLSKVAASLLFLILIPFFLLWHYGGLQQSGEEEIALREVITGKGQFTQIRLSDGSSILLHAESTLSFPERFPDNVRETWLEGEAYFEVKDDSQRSFRVNAGGALIEVLGTSFTIHSRPSEDGSVNVVVAEGEVILRGEVESDEQAVTIKKGMMSSWSEKSGTIAPMTIDLQRQLAWIRGDLIFDSTPLTDVIIQLERRYNIIIQVEDESILQRRLTANYQAEPIDEIIKNVALSVGIHYRKENDKIYLLK
jgi:transmembrane sensor